MKTDTRNGTLASQPRNWHSARTHADRSAVHPPHGTPASPEISPQRKIGPGLALAAALLLLLSPTDGLAQAATPIAASGDPAATLIEDPPPPGWIDRIDGMFASTVSVLDTILFYQLWQTERAFVVYEPVGVYIRERGSQQPFQRWQSTDPTAPEELTPSTVDSLLARGLLITGHTGLPAGIHHGRIGSQLVEFVRVKQSGPAPEIATFGDRFVQETTAASGQLFRKISPKRDVPTEITVSPETVQDWGQAGALRQNDAAAAGEPPYLFRENVGGIPLIVAWLAAGALFFTIYMRFFNLWGFTHALRVITGRYDNPHDTGEVTHFQALSVALSGTIGLGNIAGVTIAMTLGGPGAFFWMLMSGFLGMSTKFVECTLGLKYRKIHADGTVLGGPMQYLKEGFAEFGFERVGILLAGLFAVICMCASLGGGNMLQANQAGSAMLQMFQQHDLDRLSELNDRIAKVAESEAGIPLELQQERAELRQHLSSFERNFKILYGLVMAAMVGVVILGGVKRLGKAAEKIVPAMCLLYISACLFIIARHIQEIPALVQLIITEAFTGKALGGGVLGAFVIGVRRAVFSHEAGNGTAAIAHSAARTEEPIREGCVALLEPFIDTIIVCSMTALVILITGAWDRDAWVVDQGLQGAALTSRAFREEISWFPSVLSIAVMLFAYSTIISNAYYGERSWAFLFGRRSVIAYKILTVICVFVGTLISLNHIIDLSDMMTLGMAFPNIVGLLLLAPQVRRDLYDYWSRTQADDSFRPPATPLPDAAGSPAAGES